jgi:hypothetical protein
MTMIEETKDIVVQEAVREEVPIETALKVPATEQDAVAPQQPAKKPESPVRVSYIVGVREDGSFVFNIGGSKPGLLEILGLHSFAANKIRLIYEKAQLEGDAAIHAQFQQLHQKFNKTLETLNGLFTSLAMEQKEKEIAIEPSPGVNDIKK